MNPFTSQKTSYVNREAPRAAFEPRKDSLILSNHEGFHDGFHEGRSSLWGPWTPPRPDNFSLNEGSQGRMAKVAIMPKCALAIF